MYLRRILAISLIIIVSGTLLTYGFYKALPLILGPKVVISYPTEGLIVEGTTIYVRGTVFRAKELYINGIPTAFSENGLFETKLAIYPSHNILIIEAQDGFKRKSILTLNIGTR